ncbi:recombinase family protein [Micromonospora sp. NPDC049081]|uniref:recombinase family protein n=1 Tax=Micromonospora sp. NPDC049081 TaxID=3155150 RepID=UPI0033E7EE6B
MRRAAIYCRISSDREGLALGVTRQEEDCRELARRHGYTIVRVFKDNDTSASRHSKKPRPEFTEMMQLAEAGQFDAIISWSTSRLTRRPLEHERLIPLFEEHKILIHTVKAGDHDYTTARGRRRAREDAARDAEEVEEAAERSRRQKIQAAMAGEWRGGRRPYGYGPVVGTDAKSGAPIIDCDRLEPAEAAEIRQATAAVIAGASLRSLAADMNARGCLTSTGKKWTGAELRRVLLRARNAGLIEIKDDNGAMKVVAKAKWPKIVNEEEWQAAVAVLSDPTRRTNHTNSAQRWLGSGLYRCAVCGDTVRATQVRGRRGEPRSGLTVYRCRKTTMRDREHVTKRVDQVDDLVSRVVVGWMTQPEALAALRPSSDVDVPLLRAEATSLRRRLDEADHMFAAGELDRRRLAKISSEVREKLKQVELRLTEAASTGPLAGVADAADVGAAWSALDVSRQQAIIEAICDVELHPSRKGRPPGWQPGQPYFDPETVVFRWRR